MTLVTFAVFLALAQERPAHSIDLDALTLTTRPAGCELPASPTVRTPDGRTRTGLWTGLPISSNPWKGTDRRTIAAIRERVGEPFQIPDGPPPTGRELSRYRMHLADDISEAYAAVYSTPAGDLVPVYALRFKDATRARELSAAKRAAFHVVTGDTFVEVDGSGSCWDAVITHVKSAVGGG